MAPTTRRSSFQLGYLDLAHGVGERSELGGYVSHFSAKQIEKLALGELTTAESIRVQTHIYNCPECLKKLVAITLVQEMQGLGPEPLVLPTTRKPLSFMHDTADGLVFCKVERRGRKWLALHWGDQIDGTRECASVREANEYAVTSFHQMFPEHRCTVRCKAESSDGRSDHPSIAR